MRKGLKAGVTLRELTQRRAAMMEAERHGEIQHKATNLEAAKAAVASFPDLRQAKALSCLPSGPDFLWEVEVDFKLQEIIRQPSHPALLDALWIITNLFASKEEQILQRAKAFIPYLVTFLSHPALSLAEQSAWALSNISWLFAHEIELCDGEAPLIQLLPKAPLTIAWALANFLQATGKCGRFLRSGLLETAFPLLSVDRDTSITEEILWLFAQLATHATATQIQSFAPTLLPLLSPFELRRLPSDELPLIRILGAICTHQPELCTSHTDFLLSFCPSSKPSHTKEALYALCNIATATPLHCSDRILQLGLEYDTLIATFLWNVTTHNIPFPIAPSLHLLHSTNVDVLKLFLASVILSNSLLQEMLRLQLHVNPEIQALAATFQDILEK